MISSFHTTVPVLITIVLVFAAGCCRIGEKGQEDSAFPPRTIRVAQSGEADVVGSDNTALQNAADMLRAGDTLEIGPGTYGMENSLTINCSDVVVRGTPGETVLRKGPGAASRVVDCGDYGEKVLVVEEPEKFHAGMGLTVLDDNYSGGWDVMITTIEEVRGDTLCLADRTLRDYDYEFANARVVNAFPPLCSRYADRVTFEGITVDGNKAENPYFATGCWTGGIHMYITKDSRIHNCVVRDFNGDGISVQITDNIKITHCEVTGCTGCGMHPGTGSPRAEISNCHLHHNDIDGYFLCWRVRWGLFADNIIEYNGRHGISIGHKDTDNLFLNNTIRNNRVSGIYFRKETQLQSGHRNVFRDNIIQDNGEYGVYVEPCSTDLTFENNTIGDTRKGGKRRQKYGFYLLQGAGTVELTGNEMSGHVKGDFFDENRK